MAEKLVAEPLFSMRATRGSLAFLACWTLSGTILPESLGFQTTSVRFQQGIADIQRQRVPIRRWRRSMLSTNDSPEWGWEQLSKKYENSRSSSKSMEDWKRNDGIVYIRNFLPMDVFHAIQKECASVKKVRKERSSFATGRVGAYLESHGPAGSALMNNETAARLERITGRLGLYPSDYPIEYRLYKERAHMEWHSDDLLYTIPQLEMVYTVTNNGDSVTQWRDAAGSIQEQWTEPNSVILVQAGGAEHRVLPMKRGERSIVKCLFTATDTKLDFFHESQKQFKGR